MKNRVCIFTVPSLTNVLGQKACLGPKKTDNTPFRIMLMVCHLYFWYFTTQGSDSYPSSGEMGSIGTVTLAALNEIVLNVY